MAIDPSFPTCVYRNGDSCLADSPARLKELIKDGWSERVPGSEPAATPPVPPAAVVPAEEDKDEKDDDEDEDDASPRPRSHHKKK